MTIVESSINTGGYKRDLCVISLAYGILYVSNDIEKNNPDKYKNDLVHQTEYKWDEGIKEMVQDQIEELRNDLYDFMKQKDHAKIVRSIKAKVDIGLKDAIRILMSEKVQLDVLACYILYNLVYNRNKPIHKNFIDVIDLERLKLIVNSYDAAGMKLMTKIKMNRLAIDCIASF